MAVDTSRIDPKKQSIKDAYEVPDNFLEIDISNPQTHGVGKKRYTDYEVRMRVGHSQNHCTCQMFSRSQCRYCYLLACAVVMSVFGGTPRYGS